MSYRLLVSILLINVATCLHAEELDAYELDLLYTELLGSKSSYLSVDSRKYLNDGKWHTYVRAMLYPNLSTKKICKSNIVDLVFEYLNNEPPNFKYPKDESKSTMMWLLDKSSEVCKKFAYGEKTIVGNLIPESDLLNILKNKETLVERARQKEPRLSSRYLDANKLNVASLDIITNRANDNVYQANIDFGVQCQMLSIYFQIEKEQFVVDSVYEVLC